MTNHPITDICFPDPSNHLYPSGQKVQISLASISATSKPVCECKFLNAHGVSIFILQSVAILGIIFLHIHICVFWYRCPDVMFAFPFAKVLVGEICTEQFIFLFGRMSGFISCFFSFIIFKLVNLFPITAD